MWFGMSALFNRKLNSFKEYFFDGVGVWITGLLSMLFVGIFSTIFVGIEAVKNVPTVFVNIFTGRFAEMNFSGMDIVGGIIFFLVTLVFIGFMYPRVKDLIIIIRRFVGW